MSLVNFKNSLNPNWNSLTRNFFDGFSMFPETTNVVSPAANVIEKDDSYIVTLAAPGINKDELNIKLDAGVLSISGESRKSAEDQEDNYTRREYSYSNFKRSFTLPTNVQQDDIKAKYENGELILTIPKVEVEVSNQKSIEID